jgi:hypothetical protein
MTKRGFPPIYPGKILLEDFLKPNYRYGRIRAMPVLLYEVTWHGEYIWTGILKFEINGLEEPSLLKPHHYEVDTGSAFSVSSLGCNHRYSLTAKFIRSISVK